MAPPHTMFDSSPEASATSERSEQLPSVEEVKMMQATDRESMRSLSSKPSDIETAFSGSQELSEHDQLPSVEDVRLDSPRNGKCRRVVKISFWTALLVIVTVTAVTLAVVLTKDDNSNGGIMEDEDFFVGDASVPVDSSPVIPDKTEAPVETTATSNAPASDTASENTSENGFVSRVPAAIQLLSEAGVSSKSRLEQEGSAQQKAVYFVADQDPTPVALNEADAFVERYVLAVFFYSTGGQEWQNKLNFLSDLPTCRWYINGFAADKRTARKYGASCNDDGKVARIHIRKSILRQRDTAVV